MLRIGILGSTNGTNLIRLHSAMQSGELQANIALVVSNKKEAGILSKAQAYHLPYLYLSSADLTRAAYDDKLATVCKNAHLELLVLIGYMRILSADFVKAWTGRIINVHPSLLPLHAGKMDMAVHASVLANKEKTSGCSVHFVTEHVDAGPVLLQRTCQVLTTDTPADLKKRVQQLEGDALVQAINQLANSINTAAARC